MVKSLTLFLKKQLMQIIIEIKNPGILKRLLDLLRLTEWLGGVRVWKKDDDQATRELIYDFPPTGSDSAQQPRLDYREFWAIIQPQIGVENVDRLIAEMRED